MSRSSNRTGGLTVFLTAESQGRELITTGALRNRPEPPDQDFYLGPATRAEQIVHGTLVTLTDRAPPGPTVAVVDEEILVGPSVP